MTRVKDKTVDGDMEKQVQSHKTLIEQKLREVYELQHKVATLNGKRNSKLPVSKLPVELVVEIFLHYRDNAFESECYRDDLDYDRTSRKDRHQWWLTLVSVCRDWRNIALQTPLLWSILVPSICLEPYALQTFLARSVGCTLDIFVVLQGWTDQGDDALLEIFQVSERVRALFLGLNTPDDDDDDDDGWQVLEMDDASFSSLECLEVDGSFDNSFTHNLLDQILPTARNLRTLVFRHLAVQWDRLGPHLSRTITSLSLVSSYTGWTKKHHNILNILHDLPSLESLKICDLSSYRPSQAHLARWAKKITFPNLKCLEIRGQYVTVSSLLRVIPSRPSSRLVLNIPLQKGENANAACNTCLNVFSYIPFPSEAFSASLSFSFGQFVVHISSGTPPPKPLFTITFEHSDWQSAPSVGAYYDHLSRKVPNILSNVQNIIIGGRDVFTQLLCIPPFMKHPVTLPLQSGRDDGNADTIPVSTKNAIVFPQLKRLQISYFVLEENSRDQLSEILETRARLGYRLPSLSLTNCFMPETMKDRGRFEELKNWFGDKVDILELDGKIV